MKTIQIAGVPEHFNLPWHMAIEEGAFARRGIDLQWIDVPEGTGRMREMLDQQETHMAIILTEGIVKSIVEGDHARIVQIYIETPLLWGIHVAASSAYGHEKDLQHKKAAISRLGSGSHLMAFVHAQEQGWDQQGLQFEIVNDLEGAVAALSNGSADYFMWERFTTKPLVDNGIFRRLGDCPTPWPCFVIAAGPKLLEGESNLLPHILEVINSYTSDFAFIPSIDKTLANRYKQQLEDVRQWLALTRWSQAQLDLQTLESIQQTLAQLGLIPGIKSPESILYDAS